MKKIILLIKIYVFWILLFVLQKIIFMFFHFTESFELPIADWFRIIWHGLRLDLSAGAYLMLIPGLIVAAGFILGNRLLMMAVNWYVYIMTGIIVLLGVADMELYSYWGFKLDITPLLYLRTPGEAMASVNISELILLLFSCALLSYIFIFLYLKWINIPHENLKKQDWKTSVAGFLFTCALIIPARGGIGIATLNLGAVYFHNEKFANHSAINVLWNTLYSLTEKNKLISSFNFMPHEKANLLFTGLHPENESPSTTPAIIKNRANIILIILEGFSNKIIESFGGEKGITPELNQLYKEGLAFTKFFSSGDRSDKGLIALFSGFPAQPLTTIINYPSKTQKLPFLKDPFHKNGYFTAFYHGGNLDFANFRSYFARESIDHIIDINNFPRSLREQKWGVPDNHVYDRIIKDLDEIREPFFISFFSLSSHEPFDVPAPPLFGNSGRDALSRNAFHYADRCLGEFVKQAKLKPWWENTLIIILADHGSRSPGNTPNHERLKFEIPMLWIGGGLLTAPDTVNIYGSQVDLPATLLNQCGYDYSSFFYSKDILSPRTNGYAYYAFNNGFGFFNDSIELIYDNSSETFIRNSGKNAAEWYDYPKAILQLTTNDFLKK